MDIEIINNTIAELENRERLSMENVINLASLYTIRDHQSADNVTDELYDILPAYSSYVQVKRDYQLGKTSEGDVIRHMKLLCEEISEFLLILYKSAEMCKERKLLTETVCSILEHYTT